MTDHLLLLGHGSHLDANSSAPVRRLAVDPALKQRFTSVRMAFWKEEPSLSRALDGYAAGDRVAAVPVFISNGYFVRDVLPRELGLDLPPEGVDIRYTPPVGDHPQLACVAALRAQEMDASAADAVVILGHGTRRNSDSERNVYAQAQRVRDLHLFGEVAAVFMDQEPQMREVFDLVAAETVVIVPLFIADGWHVGQTIPEDLALEGGELRPNGRRLRYAEPVGTHPAISSVVLELANGALR